MPEFSHESFAFFCFDGLSSSNDDERKEWRGQDSKGHNEVNLNVKKNCREKQWNDPPQYIVADSSGYNCKSENFQLLIYERLQADLLPDLWIDAGDKHDNDRASRTDDFTDNTNSVNKLCQVIDVGVSISGLAHNLVNRIRGNKQPLKAEYDNVGLVDFIVDVF